MTPTPMLAEVTTQRSVAMVIGAVVFIGALLVILAQMRKGRAELGSEIELAANRRPYLPDADLEGPKLNLALWTAFGLLVVTALSLPLYWLAEPGRQEGAVEGFQTIFEERGLEIYKNTAKCEGCHGPEGSGGQASFVITDENGKFVSQVNWNAPALDTVLYRYSEAEVKDVLIYGRPGSPMPAWGTAGGGPLTNQQLDNVIDYLWSVQIKPDEVRAQVDDYVKGRDEGLHDRMLAVRDANRDVEDPTTDEFTRLSRADELLLGEILFNSTDLAAGGYSCARCHVPGASYGRPWEAIDVLARGRMAPDLVGIEQNLTERQHFNLIMAGSEYGKLYGANSVGSGRMPGFGLNANEGSDFDLRKFGPKGMLSAEQVWAVVTYERNLSTERAVQTVRAAEGASR